MGVGAVVRVIRVDGVVVAALEVGRKDAKIQPPPQAEYHEPLSRCLSSGGPDLSPSWRVHKLVDLGILFLASL